jgi:hypothetical protein
VTEPRTTGKTDPAAEAIAAAIGRLTGDGAGATPADIATTAGVAYSTTNKKLRALREAGRAESFDSPDKRTLWRLTTAGQTGAATEPEPVEPAAGTEPGPAAAEPAPRTGPTPDDGDPGVAEAGDEKTDAAPAGEDEPADEPADDGAAAGDAPPIPAAAADPAPEPTVQPDGAGPQDGQADPPDTDTADGAADGGAGAGGTAKPATPSGARARRTTRQTAPSDADGTPGTSRRAGGTLRGAILDILEANPDQQYKVAALCKAIDAANAGTGTARASQGAVYNAVVKLVADRRAVQTVDRPATFQIAAPPAAD